MNRYRDYMSRITAPAELAGRVLAGERPRRPHPGLAAGALAACCLAAAVGGWQLWQGRAPAEPNPTAGVAATPAATRPVQESGHTLTVADPWEGQVHSFPCVTAYDFPDCTGSEVMVGDYAYPKGWFMETLTAQEIIAVLGGTDEVPWILDWTGFGLDGSVIYDGEGQPWRIDIIGQRGEEELQLELWPGQEPLIDLLYAEAAAQSSNVTTYSLHYDRDGDGDQEYVYHAHYFDGTMGVVIEYAGPEQDVGPALVSLAAGHRGFTADELRPDAVPAWRSEELDLSQVYQEELARYLPDRASVPDSFAFDSGYRELGQDRDWLRALWCRGYDDINISASRFPAGASLLAPDFRSDEVTPQALEELGRYVDGADQGEAPGWRYGPFTVHYTEPDGGTVAVTYTIEGLDPEQAAALVNSCPAAG